jgi:hypothetical protein
VGVGVVDDEVFAMVRVADGVALSEALGVLVRVADADGLACDAVLVGVGVSAGLVGDFVSAFGGDCDGVAAGLDVSVRVGAGVGSDGVVPEPVAPDGDGLADRLALELPVVVGDGLVVTLVDVGVGVLAVGVGVVAVGLGVVGFEVGVLGVEVGVVGVVLGVLAVEVGVVVGVVGVGVGVVGVAVGVCEVGVGEGDELGSCSGSHDLPLDVMAALAAVVPATTVRLTPEVAVSRALPAIRVTVTGRACAKRINALTQCCSLLLWNDASTTEWLHQG